MDRGTWRATVYRVAKRQTWLKWLSTQTYFPSPQPPIIIGWLCYELEEQTQVWFSNTGAQLFSCFEIYSPNIFMANSFIILFLSRDATSSDSPFLLTKARNQSIRKLIKLITWITALSNSMKLWAKLYKTTQAGQRSDKTWPTGEGNGKPLQYSYLENSMNSMKSQKYMTLWKMNSPGWKVPKMLLENSGEITPERMKRWSQGESNAQLWMWLVKEVKSDAVKNNIA